jgi:hypothetical protein
MTLAQYIQDQRTQTQLDTLARLQDDTREQMLRTLAEIDSQYDDHDHAYDPYRHWELVTK